MGRIDGSIVFGRQRRSFDKTPPPWAQRPSLPYGFPIERQREFAPLCGVEELCQAHLRLRE